MQRGDAAEQFGQKFDELQERFLDVTFDKERLCDRSGPLLRTVREIIDRILLSPAKGRGRGIKETVISRAVLSWMVLKSWQTSRKRIVVSRCSVG